MRILNRFIGPDHPPYIVAEMSANHNGCFNRARSIVEAAAWAGCDAVKIQLYDPLRLATARGGKDKVLDHGIWKGRTLLDIYTQGAFHYDWLPAIVQYAKDCKIALFASVFDEMAITISEMHNLPAIKVSSFDAANVPLLKAVAKTGRPVILSSGMASVEEMAYALGDTFGCDRAVLHCVSAYPCPPSKANLQRIDELAYYLQVPIGFSDHTAGMDVAIAAVARGACIIEKHMTLSDEDGGLDAQFSITPNEMKVLVDGCNVAWRACRYDPKAEAAEEFKELRVEARG